MQGLLNPRTATLLLALASVTALAAAFISQYGFDLQPCVLCIYQRWPYAIAIALCLGVQTPLTRPMIGYALVLTALALAINSGIAAYHVGVEQHWWAGSESCVGQGGTAQTLDALRAQIMATPVTRCDEVAFSVFGVSMAGYNVLFSLALAAYAGLAGRFSFGTMQER
ncbi:MAG: disulfide bond formation protein B [Rhodospirillaceae bacterium]|jgi:disulfide bond formation protein DsbB|nr:disulfide bond formation protein B [Rhodospirillaceae bacterium]MBT5192967.1 disulfide bond formation protein B [Rhodospirillaceae bacterium]MBT5898914.1 disulfide bond formation protein B [Rhodospirillaceae bacterium]MBT6430969.1 disulfide bond formation protein B [Rhodospirillaceae bacterium]MBT7758535.1 disulfide bond formation protein B [Rhodospirillaceae bacterium]